MKNNRIGHCYALSAIHCARMPPTPDGGPFLIHGVIKSTALLPEHSHVCVICHAWIEDGENMIDVVTKTTLPSPIFMRIFDAEIIHRYSQKEAIARTADSGHYGPWEEMPDAAQILLNGEMPCVK